MNSISKRWEEERETNYAGSENETKVSSGLKKKKIKFKTAIVLKNLHLGGLF